MQPANSREATVGLIGFAFGSDPIGPKPRLYIES